MLCAIIFPTRSVHLGRFLISTLSYLQMTAWATVFSALLEERKFILQLTKRRQIRNDTIPRFFLLQFRGVSDIIKKLSSAGVME